MILLQYGIRVWFMSVLILIGISCSSFRTHGLEQGLLEEGVYQMRLVATSGSQEGEAVEGETTLVRAEENDRSPTSGQKVRDLREVEFWGSTNLPLESVGAPLCGTRIKPGNHDPLFPGVIVIEMDDNPFLILIATAANRRDGVIASDGCGIRLEIHRATKDGCLKGRWKEWGIVRDGRGKFSMCPAKK